MARVRLTGTEEIKKLRWGKRKKCKSRQERKAETGTEKAGDSSQVCQNR